MFMGIIQSDKLVWEYDHGLVILRTLVQLPLSQITLCDHTQEWSPKCAAITGVGVDISPHCFIKCPNGSASYTASGSKV